MLLICPPFIFLLNCIINIDRSFLLSKPPYTLFVIKLVVSQADYLTIYSVFWLPENST